eukprot:gene14318-20302_t
MQAAPHRSLSLSLSCASNGRIEYKESYFWREKYCKHHNLEAGSTRCLSCNRHRPNGEEVMCDVGLQPALGMHCPLRTMSSHRATVTVLMVKSSSTKSPSFALFRTSSKSPSFALFRHIDQITLFCPLFHIVQIALFRPL